MLGILILVLAMLPCVTTKQMNTSELTEKLKKIFKTYDKRILPSLNGDAINVTMQLYIIDMMPEKRYHMDPTRDSSVLEGIKYNSVGDISWNAFGIELVNDIWIPEIHFPEAKRGKWYTLMKPNTALHIHEDGKILLSRRVVLTLFCPMDLHNFPFDQQTCQMDIRFYAYSNEHCRLGWNYDKGGPLYLQENLAISEYALKSASYGRRVDDLFSAGKYDTLSVTFILERKTSYHIINYMLPCALIVILSWVGFWIDHRSTPARASLGITTVLTITSLSNSIRSSLPNVAYIKSIDIYLLACFLFVFASTLEFAVTGVTDRKWLKSHNKRQKEGEENARKSKQSTNIAEKNLNSSQNKEFSGSQWSRDEIEPEKGMEQSSMAMQGNDAQSISIHIRKRHVQSNVSKQNNKSPKSNIEHVGCFRRHWRKMVNNLVDKHYKQRMEVHIIDKISRRLFPLMFLIFNSIYFAVVLVWH